MAPRPPDALLSLRSDEQLACLAREGDEHAFAMIVERYSRELHAFAGRMRSDGRADDLVQQTFLGAFTALRAGTEVKHLRGWLYRILRNEASRASSGRVVEVELDPTSVASESLEEAAQRRMLAFDALSSIAALPDRQRHVLVASALNGESRADVAGSMGLSEGAVRQLMHRARATLRAAAAAITPAPLADWVTALRSAPATDQVPEIAIGAGAAPTVGVAIKLGAILASGALATGIVGSQLSSRSTHRGVVRVKAQRASGSARAELPGVISSGPGGLRVRAAGVAAAAAAAAGGKSPGAAAAVIHVHALSVGVADGSARRGDLRGHDHHRATSRGDRHQVGGVPGPNGASGADGGSRTSESSAGKRSSGEDTPSGSGGSRGELPTGSDGGGSGQSDGGQSVVRTDGGGAGSGESLTGGGSGSTSSDGGRSGDASGDVASAGTRSSDVRSSSSSDSGGATTQVRDSSGSDGSGK